ncbi:type VI secretion system Vgr family protein [Pseudomonas sp. C32]|uniref:type VI secretion system Vgr family protein n=1 Tax=Pseudomonas sp. C32 TaxID=1529208 RepID=UPI0026022B8B|nr:contractile injection system protein, VgrG/Pvc8 family [Pseudomonas sp. C32]MDN4544139.1 contractile injection system protein, VgrG/Pvc8 family [Pseudomonas sp. C32]
MHNDTQSPFTLSLLDDDLHFQVVRFSGHEALNQPYRFEIEVIGLAPALSLERLQNQPAYLGLGPGQGVHGVLCSTGLEYRGTFQVAYKLQLIPRLKTLDQHRRRIFQHLSVPMILHRLLEENELPADSYRFELTTGQYPVRAFCIQYEETDLDLLQRLCEEEGIHYHFEHQRDGHVLVLADDSLSFPQDALLTTFQSDAFDETKEPMITELFQRHVSRPSPPRPVPGNRGTANVTDGAANHSLPPTMPPLRSPARDQLSRRQLERLRCRQLQIEGRSHLGALRSARIVQVSGHPLTSFNDQWLVTEVWHQGQPISPFAENTPGVTLEYHNRFTAIPWSTAFRPALKQPRPNIPGYQPARVCGPIGQPADRDEQGRIRVNIWSSLQTDTDESAGLWLPVALACAQDPGNLSRLPVAGSDVLVSFLDSDPDRPVLCAVMAPLEPPRPAPNPRPVGDSRLLLDWLVNRSDFEL